jgi:hypothetical protein
VGLQFHCESDGFGKKGTPAGRENLDAGGRVKDDLLFLFLGGRHGCLSRLGLGQTLLEFIDAACRIDEFLCARVERMAHVANADHHRRLRRAGFDDVPAGASYFRINVFRMYLLSHKKVVHDSRPRAVDKLDFFAGAKNTGILFFFGALHLK